VAIRRNLVTMRDVVVKFDGGNKARRDDAERRDEAKVATGWGATR